MRSFDVTLENRGELEPDDPARTRHSRWLGQSASRFDRGAEGVVADVKHPADLRAKNEGRVSPVLPVELPVVVAQAGEPAILEVVGQRRRDDQAVDAGPIRVAGKGHRVLKHGASHQILDARVHERRGRAGLPLTVTERLLGRCRKYQRWSKAPLPPRCLEDEHIEDLQVANARRLTGDGSDGNGG